MTGMATTNPRRYSLAPAFTLVELLVIIAIIAILKGTLLPEMARAKEKSRATRCISNLLQWGLAIRMYADDNDDCLPRRGQGVLMLFQFDRRDDWFNALPPYLGAASLQQLVITSNRPVAKAQFVSSARPPPIQRRSTSCFTR